jgi:hypothetical protein
MKKKKDVECDSCGAPKEIDLQDDTEYMYWMCDSCRAYDETSEDAWRQISDRKA